MGEMTSAHYKNREMEMITPRLISDVRYSFAPNICQVNYDFYDKCGPIVSSLFNVFLKMKYNRDSPYWLFIIQKL
jgi:hypothetical protein